MRGSANVIGLPIVASDGTSVGTVCDLVFFETGEFFGFLVKGKGLFGRKMVLPYATLDSAGMDCLVVSQTDPLIKLEASTFTLTHQHKLQGKRVVSQNGEALGILDQVYFSDDLGNIVAYECSDGFFADVTEGKPVYTTSGPANITGDAIVLEPTNEREGVRNEVSQLWEEGHR
ncbi:PRC-barrel domain-containing protein [Bacillus fonticola]|uniref:PRC-barrel domain-containing protein n=1 Tax=Bacillus fonticola TaxID=2728853 RepID=UPI001475FE1F|nr:PRC-barrel domain-containing protein [Bacillus fonticola]